MEKNSIGKYEWILKTIGPGILMAGAAIGVSHLVQATRAGADYGFTLLWVLVLACISKYPFLEFGPRFAAATGNHLIHGYQKMGGGAFGVYTVLTLSTMFIIQAAVTVVTAGLAEHLFGFGWSHITWSAVVLAFCIAILLIGRYPGLDLLMRIIITLLTICTLAAVVIAIGAGAAKEAVVIDPPSYWNAAGLAFIIAFMGWMPIPLDASVWHSIWSREKARETGFQPNTKQALWDFNLGYLSAAFIGLLFFLLGALIMFGSGTGFSASSVQFSAQLIDLYGQTLGSWSIPLVSAAAFITMFSTTLAVTDAYPRVVVELRETWLQKSQPKEIRWRTYAITILVVPAIAIFILSFLMGSFTILIDFAAGLSFISAPILAWYNLRLITSDQMPGELQPGKNYRIFSWCCFAFLVAFIMVYLYWTFIA